MCLRKKMVATALALLVTLSLGGQPASASAFQDVPDGYWCAQSVNAMAGGGLIQGYDDGTYRPGNSMSTGAFVTIIARCAGTDAGADGDGWWCGATVRKALSAGWLSAYYEAAPVTVASYRQDITRETAICVLMRGLKPKDRKLGYTAADIPDYTSISADLRTTVLAAYNAGITKGSASGTFAPGARLTRGQAAELLYRAGYTKAAEQQTSSVTDGCQVEYLDVGQADAILIRCGGHDMLIDGGNVADSSLIVSRLKRSNITYLDDIICTHAHEDHVGGLSGALNQAKVGTVYAPVTSYNSKAFRNFVKYVTAQGKSITVPKAGSTFQLGEATCQFIGPQRSDYEEVNDTSLVVRMSYGKTSFLFTGDAGEESEADMLASGLPLKSTVLKVGHHGSSSATSYQFLRAVAPEDAVISVGAGNSYGHPTDAVLSRLRDADVKVYRTDLQGTILAVSDGVSVTFTTEKNASAMTNPTLADGSGQKSQAAAYVGNTRSGRFQPLSFTGLPSAEHQVFFESWAAAIQAGYTPSGRLGA